MAKTLELTFTNGSRIHIEGSEAAATERGLDDVVERVTDSFDTALGSLQQIADGLQASLARAAVPPDAVSVRFGLNFTAEAGVILTKGSVGANLEITMEWKKG